MDVCIGIYVNFLAVHEHVKYIHPSSCTCVHARRHTYRQADRLMYVVYVMDYPRSFFIGDSESCRPCAFFVWAARLNFSEVC